MAGRGSSAKSSTHASSRFVKTWGELPSGEWLDNDEQEDYAGPEVLPLLTVNAVSE
jgi:hypothetical protein